MKLRQIKIQFQFPKKSSPIINRGLFVDSILGDMRKSGDIKYVGYYNEKEFQKDMLRNIGNGNLSEYEGLSSKSKMAIKDVIVRSIDKCHKILPHPDLPVFVFVYPWFPDEKNRQYFAGTTAFAAYYTIHIFIDTKTYTEASLEQTISHEWNHLVFYRYHTEHPIRLRTHIIMEGLAEIFREEIFGGKPAPWSIALTNKETVTQLKSLDKILDDRSIKVYKEVFFGNEKYKRWTGYSIGYNLAKEFRVRHPNFSWMEIIMTKPENIFKASVKEEHDDN